MPWTYSQSTGQLVRTGTVVATGYSGAGRGRNNPALQASQNVGPIPRGRYRISNPRNTRTHGPHVMRLTPVGHDALGRSAFLIHGDSRARPGTASQGCIILGPAVRNRISASGDHALDVVE